MKKFDGLHNDTHALITKERGRIKSRGAANHNKLRDKSKFKQKIKCYHYGKIGRMKRNCKILKQGANKN